MLDTALDYGFTEFEFWEMTLAELRRAIESKIRMRKLLTKEKVAYDYILARLIAKGTAIAFGEKSEFPSIETVYPEFFGDIEAIAEKKAKEEEVKEQLSVLRFKQFAKFHNQKYKEVASEK